MFELQIKLHDSKQSHRLWTRRKFSVVMAKEIHDNWTGINGTTSLIKIRVSWFSAYSILPPTCLSSTVSVQGKKNKSTIKGTIRLLLNPIFLDCQSNLNPSEICDCQSKAKSTFQNGLTIQSKSNHNPVTLRKIQLQKNLKLYFVAETYNSQGRSPYQLKT